MARRTRKFIFDNTTGTMYSNIDDIADATFANIVGGLRPKTLRVAVSSPGRPVVKQVGTRAVFTRLPVLISSIYLEVTGSRGIIEALAAPVGAGIDVKLRKINSSGVSSFLGTYSLSAGSTSSTTSTTLNILNTDTIFLDVTAVGRIRPGTGLNVIITYYG